MRLAAVLAAFVSLQGAVSSPQPGPQSQTVRIDVIASDAKGRVLDNLRASDFALADDGAPQTLESVRFVRPSATGARLIALFLDEYHVSPEATERVRSAVDRLIAERVSPQDLLIVMKPLDSLYAIRATVDRDAQRAAASSFEGRRGQYEPRNSYERNFMAGVPARIESARAQVALSALNAIAVHFAKYPDQRKTLIVVSEGMGRGERRRGMEFLPTAETIVRSAQQANVSIYALNPAEAAVEGDTMTALAAETAGQAVAADLDEGLRRALDDASGYYLLTYRATRPDDGKFHAVEVRVKQPSALLRARKGYFARSPDDTLRAALLAKMSEPKPVVPLEPAPHTSPLIRAWFGTTRGSDGKTRVTFVWEPAARLTGERNRRVPARIRLTALAADNSVLFDGAVSPTGPALIDDTGAIQSRAVFDMAPGRLRLRMSVLDSADQTIDSDIRSITVRDMRSGVLIGTPEIMRARNAREFRSLENVMAVPVASREFSRTERLLIRFQAYAPEGTPVSVTARLLSRMGPMRALPVSATPEGANEIDLSLAGLAAGEYLIELSATGTGGDAKDVIDFRVTT